MADCLVTGGAGFIGSHIVRGLLEAGHRVRVLDNLCSGHAGNLDEVASRIEFVEGDICDDSAVEKAVKGVQRVFHQAALASVPLSLERPMDTHQACVTGTLNLLRHSVAAGVKRFVYAASSSCYGDQPTSSKRETDLPMPLSPYAAAKLAGELYCQSFYHSFGLETVGIRYFNVFGPRQDPQSEYSAVIPRFVSMILAGQRPVIYGDGQQSRDFVHVRNVVNANLLAATANGSAGGTFNIGCGASTTLLQLLNTLSEILGRPIQAIHQPPRAGDVRDSLADITQARKCFGYEPLITVDQGLRESIAYYEHSAAASAR